jgi:hypothetical protein
MNAKQCLIKRFMKKVKLELRAPKRKVHQAVLVQAKKVQLCQGVECTLPCCQKANCPAQQIINGCHKKVSVVTSDNTGRCLIVQEVCKCNEFVIEYIGKSLPPKSHEKKVFVMSIWWKWVILQLTEVSMVTKKGISIILVIPIVGWMLCVCWWQTLCLLVYIKIYLEWSWANIWLQLGEKSGWCIYNMLLWNKDMQRINREI